MAGAATSRDALEVHVRLLAQIGARESALDELRELANQLAAGIPISTSEVRRREKSEELAVRKADDRAHLLILWVQRRLNDALVWRGLGADRMTIAVLGEGKQVKRLPTGRGFDAERERMRQREVQGYVPLHVDATTCIRSGDLLVLDGWPARGWTLDEVKAGGRAAVSPGQERRRAAQLEFLRTGTRPTAPPGSPTVAGRVPVPYRTHLGALPALFAAARQHGQAEALLEDGMAVSVCDLALDDSQLDIARRHQNAGRRLLGKDAAPLYVATTLVARMEQRTHPRGQPLAPPTLFGIRPEDVVDVLLGRFDVQTTVAGPAVEAAFAKQGVHTRIAADPGKGDETFLVATRGQSFVTVSAPMRTQMLSELMTIETLVNLVVVLLDEAASGVALSPLTSVFCDEQHAWPGL